MEHINQILPLEKCTGCGVCIEACSKKCIGFVESPLGYLIAKVDEKKCIHCGECIRKCHQITLAPSNAPLACYAMVPKRNFMSKHYASAGAGTLLTKTFMKYYTGSVCTVKWDNQKLKANHTFLTDNDNIYDFSGSLYVESDISNVWGEIKNKLSIKQNVLLIGLPCQIGAAKTLFAKYNNLYTIELICHGVAPQNYLVEYIKKIRKKLNVKITFRAIRDFYFTLYDLDDNILYSKKADEDIYFLAFLKGIIFRENCYSCKYATKKRCADITIGDFWGIEKEKLKNQYNDKTSLVLPNTNKGEELINYCSEYAVFEKWDYEVAKKYNEQLNHPFKSSADRIKFVNNYRKSFFSAIKKTNTYRILQKKYIYQKIYKIKQMIIIFLKNYKF